VPIGGEEEARLLLLLLAVASHCRRRRYGAYYVGDIFGAYYMGNIEPAESDPSRVVYPLEGRRKLDCFDCYCCCWRWHRTVVAGGTARTTWATFFGALDGPLDVSVRLAARLNGRSLARRAAYVGRPTPRPRTRLLLRWHRTERAFFDSGMTNEFIKLVHGGVLRCAEPVARRRWESGAPKVRERCG